MELTSVYHDGHISTLATHFLGRTPEGMEVRATRKIEYKKNASKHECDSRCMNAKGRHMNCECRCGGANHGRGVLTIV